MLTGLWVNAFNRIGPPYHVPLSGQGVVLVEGVNLDGGDVTDSNGAGKSMAIVETILWCLYGKMARHKDRAVTHQAVNLRRGADVVVGIRSGGAELRVQRQRGVKGSAMFRVTTADGSATVPVSKDPGKRADDVADLLGYDYAACRTAIVVSGEYSLARSGFAQQMSVLEAVLHLDEFGTVSADASKEANVLEKDIAAAKVEVRLREQAVADASALVQQIEAEVSVDHAATSARLREELERAEWAANMAPQLQQVVHDTSRQRDAAVRAAATAQGEYARLVQAKAQAESRARNTGPSTCPTCRRPYENAQELYNARAAAQAEADALVPEVQKADQERSASQQRVAAAEARLHAQQEELQKCRTQAAQRDRILQQLQALEVQQAQHVQRLESARERHQSANAQLGEAGARLTALNRVHWRTMFWAVHAGRDGMQADVFQSAVPLLDHAAARYSQALTSGKIKVRFNPQRDSRNEDLIKIEVDGKTLSYDDLSKGEKARADVMVSLAMRDLARLRLGANPLNVAIYDEIFDPLDASGLRAVAKLLQEEATKGSTVFVVTHSATLKALFPGAKVLRVVRQNDEATVTYVA